MTKLMAEEVRETIVGGPERSDGERSEAPRSGGSSTIERVSSGSAQEIPDPEVVAGPKRRRFTAEYKLRVVKEADACKGVGEIGALLRREGLYSSHLVHWRRQREEAARTQLKTSRRGPKPKLQDPRLKQVEREKAQLERRLKRAETIIEIQKNFRARQAVPPTGPETLFAATLVCSGQWPSAYW